MSIPVIRFSKKTEYALRALLYMASSPQGHIHSLHDICASENMPIKFLEQALGQLKNAGILTSRRGSRGGYLLARKPKTILIGEILTALEGGNALTEIDLSTVTQSQKALTMLLQNAEEALEEPLHDCSLLDVLRLASVSTEPDFII